MTNLSIGGNFRLSFLSISPIRSYKTYSPRQRAVGSFLAFGRFLYQNPRLLCWLNDSVIASRAMQAEKLARRILIIDCDVHQGNGTAAILKNDPTIFTFSIHGKNNFPLHKAKGDLDIALPDGADDRLYFEALEGGLDRAVKSAAAQLVIYLAGADPFKEDRFGRMSLTKEGLARRDRLVFQHCYGAGLPMAVTMAGGYARLVPDTADIHFQTILTALEFELCYR